MKPTPLTHFTLAPRRRAAFTLVEMLLVLVILATLAAIVIPRMAGRTQQAKTTAAITQVDSIGTALELFEADNGYFPKTGALGDLVDAPAGASNWKGPYLKKGIPNDPWGGSYDYAYPGKHNANSYDLMSPGADGRAGTDDDVTNWDKK